MSNYKHILSDSYKLIVTVPTFIQRINHASRGSLRSADDPFLPDVAHFLPLLFQCSQLNRKRDELTFKLQNFKY